MLHKWENDSRASAPPLGRENNYSTQVNYYFKIVFREECEFDWMQALSGCSTYRVLDLIWCQWQAFSVSLLQLSKAGLFRLLIIWLRSLKLFWLGYPVGINAAVPLSWNNTERILRQFYQWSFVGLKWNPKGLHFRSFKVNLNIDQVQYSHNE